jgi:hypothetical protein
MRAVCLVRLSITKSGALFIAKAAGFRCGEDGIAA